MATSRAHANEHWFFECPPQGDAEFQEWLDPSPMRVSEAAGTSCSATTMSQSMIGLASPGTEVLPTLDGHYG
jgi:hypothetical protein